MVRGIYQTSDAGKRPAMVTVGISVALTLMTIACIFASIQWGGDKICSMPGYWNATDTYSAHAKQALSTLGYEFESVSDKGDWPRYNDYCDLSSVKLRRFIVTGFEGPGMYMKKAEVIIKFDGKARPVPATSLESFKSL